MWWCTGCKLHAIDVGMKRDVRATPTEHLLDACCHWHANISEFRHKLLLNIDHVHFINHSFNSRYQNIYYIQLQNEQFIDTFCLWQNLGKTCYLLLYSKKFKSSLLANCHSMAPKIDPQLRYDAKNNCVLIIIYGVEKTTTITSFSDSCWFQISFIMGRELRCCVKIAVFT